MLIAKVPANKIRVGDYIYMYNKFPQVKSVEPIHQSTGDAQIKVELMSEDNKQLIRFYAPDRMVIVRR